MSGRQYYESPVGDLIIESENEKIITVNFSRDIRLEEFKTPVIDQCVTELDGYFFSGRKFFTVGLELRGSDFQKKVWNELLNVPYGSTLSYESIAIRVGNIKSIRAVGLANGQNPIAIIVPCHRIIGKNGDLVGYGGGLENKKWLLYHEGAILRQLSIF
ncbi:MAG: methylated-DNA--[protein]-cysteine S-methyltransferase [Chryseolinea sp.]